MWYNIDIKHQFVYNIVFTKIFLSSQGIANDVTPEVKAFLNYMNGLPVTDDFIKEIDDCINETKTNHEERVSYMTYEMKMQEAHDEGRAEGERNMEMTIVKRMLLKHKPLIEIIDAVDWSRERVIAFAKENNIPITE